MCNIHVGRIFKFALDKAESGLRIGIVRFYSQHRI